MSNKKQKETPVTQIANIQARGYHNMYELLDIIVDYKNSKEQNDDVDHAVHLLAWKIADPEMKKKDNQWQEYNLKGKFEDTLNEYIYKDLRHRTFMATLKELKVNELNQDEELRSKFLTGMPKDFSLGGLMFIQYLRQSSEDITIVEKKLIKLKDDLLKGGYLTKNDDNHIFFEEDKLWVGGKPMHEYNTRKGRSTAYDLNKGEKHRRA